MRRVLVAGNWKMNKTISEARTLAREVAQGVAEENFSDVDVLLGPPYSRPFGGDGGGVR